jgi:CheY-like chemotaxis protein
LSDTGIKEWEADMAVKILVVDDEHDVRTFLSGVLEREGYSTIVAADGVEAFELLEREKPDLVILDLQMPNQTGTDFYRRLTHHHEMAETPVIVVSGIAGRHLAVSEPFAVFDKPIDEGDFVAAVEKALEKGQTGA